MSCKPPTGAGGGWENVLNDLIEAAATGREPEDIQAERHARERQAATARCRCATSRWVRIWHTALRGSRCRPRHTR